MKRCPTCDGDCFVTDGIGTGTPFVALCPTCYGSGAIPDPMVPRDRGVDRYAPRR